MSDGCAGDVLWAAWRQIESRVSGSLWGPMSEQVSVDVRSRMLNEVCRRVNEAVRSVGSHVGAHMGGGM